MKKELDWVQSEIKVIERHEDNAMEQIKECQACNGGYTHHQLDLSFFRGKLSILRQMEERLKNKLMENK